MIEALNTKAAQVVAGCLMLFLVGCGIYIWTQYHGYLAALVVVNLTVGCAALWVWVIVRIKRAYRAPHVVYDKADGRVVRMVDAQVLPHPVYPSGLQSLTTHYDPRINALAAPPVDPVDAAPPLPVAKSVYECASAMLAGEGRILLGFERVGAETLPIWQDVGDLLSIALAGNSGRGKSNALLWLVVQFIRQGIQTSILDGKGDLRKWLGAYHSVAYTPGEVAQAVRGLLAEGQRRLEVASSDAGATFPPRLVVMDELDLIEGRSGEAVQLVEMLTKKTRSVNLHGIYSNQSIPADLVGGVQTRGVIVSRICLYCDDEAARLLGVRANNGASQLLQQLAPPAPPGLAVARTAAFGWKILAFPEVPPPAISWLLDGLPPLPPLPPNPRHQNIYIAPEEAPAASTEPPRANIYSARVSEADRLFILEQHQAGKSATAIAMLMRGTPNFNTIVKQVIAEADAAASKETEHP